MADADPFSPPMAVPAPDPWLVRAAYDLNDLGNARRLRAVVDGRLLWIEDIEAWVFFDGQRWTRHEGKGAALAAAQRVAADMVHEIRALRIAADDRNHGEAALKAVFGKGYTPEMAKERAGELYGHMMKTGNAERCNAMLRQAQGLLIDDDAGPAGGFVMRASLDGFDTDPLAWHCRNGTLRFIEDPLSIGRDDWEGPRWEVRFTRGHFAADRFMQMADVDYDADAACPHWEQRLTELHDDPVAREALRRIFGMTLTARISDQAFYIFQGKGNDGKSMTCDVIGALQGDYYRSASPKTFLEGREGGSSEHQSDVARLSGDIRLVVADEPKKKSVWNGERIKQATGGRIVARAPHAREEIEFAVHWKLIVLCNSLPRAPSDDRGFRRRFKLNPWLKSYGVSPGLVDEQYEEVKARLMGEAAGIVNWMIGGALAWLESGDIPEPSIARTATASFWENTSPIGSWLEARCDTSDAASVEMATPLYEDFAKYCKEELGIAQEMIMKQRSFGDALNDLHIYGGRDSRTNLATRIGIRLKPEGFMAAPAGEGDGDGDFDPFGGAL
jgi:putative DNA primase/helicase